MPNSITVQGEVNPYTTSGRGTVTNTGTFQDPNNIGQTVADLENVGGIKASREFTASPATGTTVQIPNNVDSVNIQGGATLAALTIVFMLAPVNGQNIRFIFDVAVTTLTISAPTGYTVEAAGAVTNATAGGHFTYECIGTVWKPA